MDAVDDLQELLNEAEAASLTIMAEGEQLCVGGPRSAAPIVQRLGAHKHEILNLYARPGHAALPGNEGERSQTFKRFIRMLGVWRPAGPRDLPPVPPFHRTSPQHDAAWAAWWDALARRNRLLGGK